MEKINSDEAAARLDRLVKAKEGSAMREERRAPKGHRDIELGAVVAAFSFAVMLPRLCLSPEIKRPNSARLDISMLLALSSSLGGIAFVLLSMKFLGLPEHLVSSGQSAASRFLFVVCNVLPVLTLLSLPLVVVPYKPYMCIGLTVVAVAIALLLALVRRYRRHKAGVDDEAYEEHKEELEAVCV